ncbi:hypothetical protein EW145_g6377 [Phellinidium pouzarii]|uniref:DUF1308 domain-containing protein n=1 Tax=Phellinidium pouzarii TaxID=167371 RepID=A0A4S4KYL7_9AGAM|nr:hypothetical protein EW145_g6377 [Phellinidium pouzarii]
MASSIENVKSMKAQLEGIYEYLPRFSLFADRLPILDILEPPSEGRIFDNEDRTIETGSDSDLTEGSGDLKSNLRSDLFRHSHASIPGLRVFRENVKHDIEQIDKFLARHLIEGANFSATTFSTNAPYLIAVWNELIRAPSPIVFVDKTFSITPGKHSTIRSAQSTSKKLPEKGATVKVDIVADFGRRWIRVNTVKNSRLLAEFREQDSYLTESDDEEDVHKAESCLCSGGCSAQRASEELENSLLQMGKALVSAAQQFPVVLCEGREPQVTLRLTRLLLDATSLSELQNLGLKTTGPTQDLITSKNSETDPRIAQTLRELLQIGIQIELGEHEFKIPAGLLTTVHAHPQLIPSHQINLDLSVLIALVSDITHASLPTSAEEALTRFIPTPAERARSRQRRQRQKELLAIAEAKRGVNTKASRLTKKVESGSTGVNANGVNGAEDMNDGESVHSRALASQAFREMECGLLEEIAGRLRLLDTGSFPSIEFWTSAEARDRCLRIVDKIGGPVEKRRASALFFHEGGALDRIFGIKYASEAEASESYWRDSRHPQVFLLGLVPLRIFGEDSELGGMGKDEAGPVNSFWGELDRACRRLLSDGAVAHPRTLPVSASLQNSAISTSSRETDDDPGRSQDAVSAGTDEIERAAVTRGNARLTTHTVKTLCWGAERRWTTLTANRASVREMLKESGKEAVHKLDVEKAVETGITTEVAAIWIVEPRSLAEGMRGDFVSNATSI